ncbi:cupin domain-containing protein [Jatrophihabitans sp. DSM 45814]
MTFLAVPGGQPAFAYAGQPMDVLAGLDGQPAGFAVANMTMPPHFAGPIPHAHDAFDEAIYVLSGQLHVLTDRGERVAEAGQLLVAPRGQRHGFRNPSDSQVVVLGLWSPSAAGLAFMRDIGSALPASGPPDPTLMAEIYERHSSRLLP